MDHSSGKKKILYICPNGYLGGAEKFVLNICEQHLIENTFNISILFFKSGVASELAKEKGIEYSILPFSFKLTKLKSFIKATIYIRRFIKDSSIDIIHSTMPYSHIVIYFSSLYLNIKRVWFQHGPVGGTLDKLAALLTVDSILFNSKFLKDQHHKSLKYFPSVKPKYGELIIPLGVTKNTSSSNEISKLRKDLFEIEKSFIIGAVGRISSLKGYETLISAISKMKGVKCFSEIGVIIIGEANSKDDQDYYKKLQNMIEDEGLGDTIRFLDFKKNIHEFISLMDILVHSPRSFEAFGLVVAEAMLEHTLVIGSQHGGVSEILIDGKTGFSFDSFSTSAPQILAGKLEFIIKEIERNEEIFNDIITCGYKLISEEYTDQKMIKTIEDHYKNLIGRQKNI